MDEVEQCAMGDDGMMGDASDMMDGMDDEVEQHVSEHAERDDADPCQEAEGLPLSDVDDAADGMMIHDHWVDDDATCMGGGMM